MWTSSLHRTVWSITYPWPSQFTKYFEQISFQLPFSVTQFEQSNNNERIYHWNGLKIFIIEMIYWKDLSLKNLSLKGFVTERIRRKDVSLKWSEKIYTEIIHGKDLSLKWFIERIYHSNDASLKGFISEKIITERISWTYIVGVIFI